MALFLCDIYCPMKKEYIAFCKKPIIKKDIKKHPGATFPLDCDYLIKGKCTYKEKEVVDYGSFGAKAISNKKVNKNG